MDNNKVTAKDVAREAGVSIATVSYVMNGRTDQKISPETRKKVLQIANLLNYVPSHAAKSLATGRNNTIGISYVLTDSPTRSAALMCFVNSLIERLNRLHYDVTFVPARREDESLYANRSVDAIVAIDLDHNLFRSLADNYMVPVICVDMMVNDTLFYQIYEDIPFLVEKALLELKNPTRSYFIFDSFSNCNYEDFVLRLPDGVFPLRHREATPSVMEGIIHEYIIINGAYLALSLMPLLKDADPGHICVLTSENESRILPLGVHVLVNNDDKKANLTMNIVMNSLKRNFELAHDHKIR